MSLENRLSKIGKMLDKFGREFGEKFALLFLERKMRKAKRREIDRQKRLSNQMNIFLCDSLLAFLSIFVAIVLRVGTGIFDYSFLYVLKNMIVFGLVGASVFLLLQTNLPFWRYMSLKDIYQVFLSVVLTNLMFLPLMVLMNQEDFLPYSVLVLNVFVMGFLLFAPRFVFLLLLDKKIYKAKNFDNILNKQESQNETQNVLLIGNNQSINVFLKELVLNDEIQFQFSPVGILSISENDVGRTIDGVSVLGGIRNLSKILKQLHDNNIFPRQIIVTEKLLPENIKNFLLKCSANNGLLLIHSINQCTFNTIVE